MVKITQKSDLPWSAIFSIIVYCCVVYRVSEKRRLLWSTQEKLETFNFPSCFWTSLWCVKMITNGLKLNNFSLVWQNNHKWSKTQHGFFSYVPKAPSVLMISPRCTHRIPLVYWTTPDVLMITPHTHLGISQCTRDNLLMYWTPHCTHDIPHTHHGKLPGVLMITPNTHLGIS